MLQKLLGISTLLALFAFAPALMADRTPVTPAWTMFTTQQDAEIGRELANDVESQLFIFEDNNANAYLDSLGNQLSAHAPGEKFTYRFKIVNDRTFNSYALPGGFIYVNRGVIEAAQNQSQLAGLVAHQIAHVALRHGSSLISNAYNSNTTYGRNRGLGGTSVRSVLSQLTIGFAPDSIPLRFTTAQERQADLLAVQILHDSGFDPRQTAQFFQREQTDSARRSSDFFNNHPNPANRYANIRREVQNLGGPPARLRTDSADFNTVKNLLLNTAEPYGNRRTGIDDRAPVSPSGRMLTYDGQDVRFNYPENWRVSEEGETITVAPSGGIVSDSLAYGMRIGSFDWYRSFGQGLAPQGGRLGASDLRQATDQLLDDLRQSNPDMRNIRSQGQMRVAGDTGLITLATNESPLGGNETDWIVTVLRPNGVLYYFVGAAPEREFNRYLPIFQDIASSVRFY